MSKVTPINQEQLIYYMLQTLSLGTYDKRFLSNTMQLSIMENKPVTSNQADLLHKITLRYTKQLAKQELDATQLVKLPWKLEPKQSLPEYTEAFISIAESEIKIRSPYKVEFVKALREIEYVKWDHDTKIWSCPASAYTLKILVRILQAHYTKINYCSEIQKVLDTVNTYKNLKCWEPTLVNRNGLLYIAGINRHLNTALETDNITFDTSLHTLAKLTYYGVQVDDSLVATKLEEMGNTDQALENIKFALTINPTMEISEPEKIVDMLKLIDADFVLTTDVYGSQSLYGVQLRETLTLNNIKYYLIDRGERKVDVAESLNLSQYRMPVFINAQGAWRHNNIKAVAKTITLVNSQPVTLHRNK